VVSLVTALVGELDDHVLDIGRVPDPAAFAAAFRTLIESEGVTGARGMHDAFDTASRAPFLKGPAAAVHSALFALAAEYPNVWLQGKINYGVARGASESFERRESGDKPRCRSSSDRATKVKACSRASESAPSSGLLSSRTGGNLVLSFGAILPVLYRRLAPRDLKQAFEFPGRPSHSGPGSGRLPRPRGEWTTC
jgi:hypothetical protein